MRGWWALVILLASALPGAAPPVLAEPVECNASSSDQIFAMDGVEANETYRMDCRNDQYQSTHSVHRIDVRTNMSGPVGKHHVLYLVEFDTGNYAGSSVCPSSSTYKGRCSQWLFTVDGTGLDSRYGEPHGGDGSTCSYRMDVKRPTGRASVYSPFQDQCTDWHVFLP